MNRFRILPAALLALVLSGCLGGSGNSGSETTNGLTGTVRDVEGRPAPGARVLLLPLDYNPVEAATTPAATATDAKGVYAFSDIKPGHYNVELSDTAHGKRTLVRDVTVREEGTAKADATLGKPGSLELRTADFVAASESAYVYIPGTTAWAPVDAEARVAGGVGLQSVPVGIYEEVLLVTRSGTERKVIVLARGVEAKSEDTVTPAAFQTWAHSRKIMIDTKAMGVSGGVADFPLLVRLHAGNFDFAQAQANGLDVRFSKPDGSSLPFQIERWDAPARQADIWARLDTVLGDDDGQYITMHWGRALAAANPAGTPVYDSASGFSAVYHLDEAANDAPGGYQDATPKGNHATAVSGGDGAQAQGVIGGAKAFSGGPLQTAGTLTAALPRGFGGNASFTVSFWMNYEKKAGRQTLMDFGKETTLENFHFLLGLDTLAQFGGFDADGDGSPAKWQNLFRLPPAGQWVHVATVYDAAASSLTTYIDGAVAARSSPTQPLKIDPASLLQIGQALETRPTEVPYNGLLDEIRFCDRPLSADRIKLEFKTQKLPL